MARRRGSYADRDGVWHAQNALIFYGKNLAPSLFLNVFVQVVSASLFMLVEEFDFGTAMYHCLVTATTVGFGDIYPREAEKYAAVKMRSDETEKCLAT